VGVNVRGPASVRTSGSAFARTSAGAELEPGPADFTLRLPWVARAGVRVAFRGRDFEAGDVEIDGTYEGWHSSDATLHVSHLSVYRDILTTVAHHYKDAFSVRVGGAYNLAQGISVRAGTFYDASVTDPAWTRVDVDTLDKLGASVGFGYRLG